MDCYVTCAPEAAVDASDIGFVHYIEGRGGKC